MSSKSLVRVGCGALIVNEKNEVLLIKRSATRNQNDYWSQPGGAVEFGETIKQAIIREIREEVNVKIRLISYLSYTEQIFKKETQHWLAISYLARIISGNVKNLEPHKHSAVKWFPIDKLPKKLSKTTVDSTRAYLTSSL